MTIRWTLESLQRQTAGSWRAVVVDDGSDDDTAVVARSVGDDRIEVIRQARRGVAAARNRGADHVADDRFVCFLDADDEVEPRHAEAMSAALCGHEAVACGYRFVGREGMSSGHRERVRAEDLTLERLLISPRLLIGAVMVAPSALDRVRRRFGDLFDGGLWCEDWDFWLRLGRVGVRWAPPVGAALLSYRRGKDSRSMDLERVHRDRRNVIRTHAPDEQVAQAAARRLALGAMCRSLVRDDLPRARAFIEEVGAIEEEDLDSLTALLRWATVVDGGVMGEDEEMAARRIEEQLRIIARLPEGVASVARRALMRDGDWRVVARCALDHLAGDQVLVVYGVGRNGSIVMDELAGESTSRIRWMDDGEAALERFERIGMQELTGNHLVLVTPDARGRMLERLASASVGGVLLPEALIAPARQVASA